MSRTGTVLYGITAGVSADKLLRGQLGWLREQGWDVHLAVNPDERAHKAAEREQIALEPLPMSRDISLADDLRSLRNWFTVIRRVRPAVTNVSTPKAGLLGGLAAAALRVPRRVYVMRGLRVEGADGPMSTVLWLMERIAVLCATDVVVVSRSLGEEARRRRLLGRRAWLVGEGSSNGVRADLVQASVAHTDGAALRERHGLQPYDVVVGFVGRITADKGVEPLLDAVATLPDQSPVRLLIIGSVDDEALGHRITAMGRRVVHVDWTDDVWSYYSAMDVLCLPTRREGYPNVVLEASAAGVPTITTTATGAVDSVVDGETGLLVAIDDSTAMAVAIESLASQPTARKAMGIAARDRVDEHYQPEDIWRGIDSILRGTPADNVHQI